MRSVLIFLVLCNLSFGEEVGQVGFERPRVGVILEEDRPNPPERIRMRIPDEAETSAKELMDNVSNYCNNKDFKNFMSCFTKKMRSEIRKKMEDLFLEHEMTMTIEEIVVYENDNSKIDFGMKYSWNSNHGHENVIFSKVTAKKEDGVWRVDSEKIQNVAANNRNAPPANQQPQFDFKGGGNVEFNVADDLLPRDIKKRPGGGCANGKCATF